MIENKIFPSSWFVLEEFRQVFISPACVIAHKKYQIFRCPIFILCQTIQKEGGVPCTKSNWSVWTPTQKTSQTVISIFQAVLYHWVKGQAPLRDTVKSTSYKTFIFPGSFHSSLDPQWPSLAHKSQLDPSSGFSFIEDTYLICFLNPRYALTEMACWCMQCIDDGKCIRLSITEMHKSELEKSVCRETFEEWR